MRDVTWIRHGLWLLTAGAGSAFILGEVKQIVRGCRDSMSASGRIGAAKPLPRVTFVIGKVTITAEDFTAHGGEGDSYSRGYMLVGPAGGHYGHISELLSSA